MTDLRDTCQHCGERYWPWYANSACVVAGPEGIGAEEGLAYAQLMVTPRRALQIIRRHARAQGRAFNDRRAA
jgi:hypothetical protein